MTGVDFIARWMHTAQSLLSAQHNHVHRLAQLRKLKGLNYQRKFDMGHKSLFHSMQRFCCRMEEILE